MAASFEIQSAIKPYRVEIGCGLVNDLTSDPAVVVLCDERFAPLFEKGDRPFIAVPASEASKSLESAPAIIVRLREIGATRATHLAVVGGGIIQDIGAFAATIYMRGLSWSYMPTTLLGMADSCIGGKSSINVDKFKNLVGGIYPPERVLIDPNFLAELPRLQRAAGLCEAAKICFARGNADFTDYLADEPGVDMGLDGFGRVVQKSLLAKKWFIERDEFDKAERLLLNFGHTFGHALEGASNFGISHGIAVGLGIFCALRLGEQLKRDYSGLTHVSRLKSHVEELLAAADGMPASLAAVSPDEACRYFLADKKHGPDKFTVIIVTADGRLERLSLPKSENTLTMCRNSFASVIGEYAS